MKRRTFLQLAGTAALAQSAAPRSVHRFSRLYKEAMVPLHTLPDILALEDQIISMSRDPPTVTTFTSLTPTGDMRWARRIPADNYRLVGTTDGGKSLLVQTMDSRTQRFDPRDGTFTSIGKADSTGFLEPMFYAGDEYLIRPASLQIELWSATTGGIKLIRSAKAAVPPLSQVELLTKGLAAVISPDARAMWMVEIPSGRVQLFELDPPPSILTSATPRVVTGSDRERGLFLALFVRSKAGLPMPLVTIDAEGKIAPYGYCGQRNWTLPLKLLKYSRELGIAYSDGVIEWSPAAVFA